jgi:DHA2 family multidrug resistance protein
VESGPPLRSQYRPRDRAGAAIAIAGIEQENAGSASALFNMMRNLGGRRYRPIADRADQARAYHSNVLTGSVSLFEESTRARFDALTQYFLKHGVTDHAEAWHQAVVAIGRTIRQQSYIMAFGDTFYLLGAGLILALIATLLLTSQNTSRPAAHIEKSAT